MSGPVRQQLGGGCRRAFTLVEVVLALSVLAVLGGLVFGFMTTMLLRRDETFERADDLAAGTAVVNWLEQDLFTSVASSRGGSGISGEPRSLELVSIGVPPGVWNGEPLVDRVVRSLEWDPPSGRVFVTGGEGEPREVLTDRVQWLRFRYYVGREARERFDSRSQGGLPVGIEVQIWLGEPIMPEEFEVFADEGFGDGFGDDGFGSDDLGFEMGLEPGLDPGLELGPEGEPLADPGFVGEEPVMPLPPTRPPDRVRLVIVPDGPDVGWSLGAVGSDDPFAGGAAGGTPGGVR